MKPNIMLVDDSVRVLKSLQWIFMDEPYQLFAFNDPSDALSIIKTLEWSVVIAEQSMQKMSGIEFLKKVLADSPHTVGIIMTTYNEFAEVLDALYPGCVYEFIKKPIDINEIKHAVKSAITHYELNLERKRPTVKY